MLRMSLRYLTHQGVCDFELLWKTQQAHHYTVKDKYAGLITMFKAKVTPKNPDSPATRLTMEAFFSPVNKTVMHNRKMDPPGNRLIGLEVGIGWDQKERIFRNFAGIIGPNDNPTLVHRWLHGDEFHVRIVWQDPLNVIAGMFQMKVEKSWVISFHKPNFNKPLRPGSWTVKIVHNDNTVLGEVTFLVLPQAYFKGQPSMLKDVVSLNNGPPAGLYSNDFVIEFDREANDTQNKVRAFGTSSVSTGTALENWVDTQVLNHWTFQGVCIRDNSFDACGVVPTCKQSGWSSLSPDPKSEIGFIRSNGGLR